MVKENLQFRILIVIKKIVKLRNAAEHLSTDLQKTGVSYVREDRICHRN